MNRPDENTLNRWLLGELEGEELRQVEAWAEEHAGELDAEFKCDIGWEALGAEFMQEVSATEEPPYPEFFNHKLQQAIEADTANQVQDLTTSAPVQSESKPSFWQKFRWMVLPTAVAAGIAFYAGSQMTTTPTPPQTQSAQPQVASYQGVYIPDSGVVAAVSESDGATEIVLKGLKPISDELDIVKGETSLGNPPTMMVIQPEPKPESTIYPVTFF